MLLWANTTLATGDQLETELRARLVSLPQVLPSGNSPSKQKGHGGGKPPGDFCFSHFHFVKPAFFSFSSGIALRISRYMSNVSCSQMLCCSSLPKKGLWSRCCFRGRPGGQGSKSPLLLPAALFLPARLQTMLKLIAIVALIALPVAFGNWYVNDVVERCQQ